MNGLHMISKKALILTGMIASTLTISACTQNKVGPADYWQRVDASSALYLQGPKAQQMLHQHIARCTAEIKELDRLGDVRRAIPSKYNSGNTLSNTSEAKANLDGWDSPDRDGYLLNEHKQFHDFETCMVSKGWERAEYLPYDDAARARQEYADGITSKRGKNIVSKEEYVRSVPPPATKPASYQNVND